MDYTLLIQAIIALITALISTFLIPWIKANKTQKQLDIWTFWVNVAVAAAEQIFTSEQWAEKKEYVMTYLNSKGIEYDEVTVNNMIEAAVLKLHSELYHSEGETNEANKQTTNTIESSENSTSEEN